MFASQLTYIIQKDTFMSKVFMGVYARDELPQPNLNHDSAYILNADTSSQPGSHWLLAYFNVKKRQVMWFDSLGHRPGKTFQNWLNRTGFKVEWNSKKIQGEGSVYCGLYVICALFYLARSYNLRNVLKLFSSRKFNENDRKVALFVWRKFKFNARRYLL